MATGEGKKNIESGWRAAGIQDAVKLGFKNLPTIDPFSDIDPILDDPRSDGQNLDALRGMSQEEISVAYLQLQSCKLYNKHMIASTEITNTEIFTFIAVLVFKLLSRKVLFINRKGSRNY